MIIGAQRTPKLICRGCGCTDDRACAGGCSWVLLDVGSPTGICSACADEMGWEMELLATAMCGEVARILSPPRELIIGASP